MTPSPEPRFAGIASLIGDPTRARMLAALLGGQFIAAGELAAAAGVTAQTASSHIAKLLESGLVVLRVQGRHRYFRLADAEVAGALEALCLVAERRASASKWEHGAYKPLKAARTCYHHIAGELGVALFEGLLARGTLVASDDGFELGAAGREQLQAIGLTLPGTMPERGRRFARRCLDWSERRDHLAGSLATALLDHGLEHGWWRRSAGSRALAVTPAGRRALAPWLERFEAPPRADPAFARAPASAQLASHVS